MRAHTRITATLSLSIPAMRAHTRITATLGLSIPAMRERQPRGLGRLRGGEWLRDGSRRGWAGSAAVNGRGAAAAGAGPAQRG